MTEEEETVAKQLEFIEWLKEKGLYDVMESVQNMHKMQRIWEAATEDNDPDAPQHEELRTAGKEFV